MRFNSRCAPHRQPGVTGQRTQSQATALVIAMGLLLMAGLAQELFLLAGEPGLGLLVSIAAAVVVAWLWQPPLAVLGIIGVGLGIELLLPLQTGGGRYQDWVLHYQMALHYAGQPSHVLADALRWRTPLYHQLSAGILATRPDYWAFQVVSVLLSSLWLWPAWLLIRDRAPDLTGSRLMAVALAPVVIAYTTYTWPWNFATFFLLAAIWLCDQTSLAARIGMGLALGGALLAHPGTVGYVVGLGAVWLYRHRAGMLPGAAGMGLALLSGAPWIAAVSGDTGLQTLVTNSIPAVAATSPYLWAVSRLLLVAHTFFPAPIATTDRLWASLVLTFFILSLPGALVTALLAARMPRPPSPLLICILTGAAIGTAIYNAAGAYLTGILDAYYPGVLILLVFVATTLDAPGVRRMFVAAFFLGGCFVTLLLLLSTFPLSGDSNVTYRSQYATIFFVQRWGLLPGLAILAAAAVINVRTVFRDWRAAGFGTGTA